MRQVMQRAVGQQREPVRPAAPAVGQRTFGNQARLRQISAPQIQAKLEIGAVNDPLEHEADAAADQVMRMADPGIALAAAPPQIHRKCDACADDDKKLQMHPTRHVPTPAHAPDSVHQTLGRPGLPLDTATQAFFAPRFGRDLSSVRVHDNPAAAASAREIGARAYAAGKDVVFSEGAYAPGTRAGQRLIAHELAHVIQQEGGALATVQRATDTPTGIPAGELRGFERHFGTSLGDVRVHDDSGAHRRAHDLGARAFTQGRDVYFSRGAYQPRSAAGRELLTHELAHVVQQRNGRFPATGAPGARATLRVDLENEADAAAASLRAGTPARVDGKGVAGEAYGDFIGDLKAHVTGGIEALADWVMAQTSAAADTMLQELNQLRQGLRGLTQLSISPETAALFQRIYDDMIGDLPSWIPKPKIDFSGGPAQSAGVLVIPIAAILLFLAFIIVMLWYAGNLDPRVRRARERAAQDVVDKIKEAINKPKEPEKEPEKKPDEDPKKKPDDPPPLGPDNPPQPQFDACQLGFGLAPGINARWHTQRAPINGNTTVSAAAFRLDAGIAPPAGQDTTDKSRDWVHAIGLANDDAGHVIGNRFGGTAAFNGTDGNIFPQNLSFNRGTMRSLDDVAAKRHAAGCDVCVQLLVNYAVDTDLRPSSVTYTLLYRSAGAVNFNPAIPAVVPNP